MRKPAGILCILFVCLTLITRIQSTRTGDEDFGTDVSGLYYAFADKAVHIINPLTLSVIKNLTKDQSGDPLTNAGALGSSGNSSSRVWNDCAFIEDASVGLRYVFVNEGDTYVDSDGQTEYSYVTGIDAVSQEIEARIRVGGRPVHLYSVNQTNTVWSHSDAEGTFYVIAVTASSNLSVVAKVPSYIDNPAHGKLVVNDAFYPLSYGTNVAEQIISKFSLANATRLDHFAYNTSLPNATLCTGTHTIVYSRINKHLFIECVDGTGTMEWNTVNDTLVRWHTNAIGAITGAPADDMVFVSDSGNSSVTMIKPKANGVPSAVFADLQVPYNPDYPAFYSNSSSELSPGNFTDYTIFFPLTRNTNINNIKAAGDNITTEDYMVAPSDCEYKSGSVSASSVGSESSATGLSLLTATNGNVLTPTCGACAAAINSTDPSQFNASLSGFGVLDLGVFVAGATNTTTNLLPAGAILPSANQATGANQCAFSTENHRQTKRGGSFVATVADLPQPSIYIVDAAASGDPLYGHVPTAANPTQLSWVPATVD